MTRVRTENTKLRRQIEISQGRAKLVGALYLLALIGFLVVSVFPVMAGGEVSLTVTQFYQPIKTAFGGGFSGLKSLSFSQVQSLTVSILYASMLLGLLINALRGFSKLGWLFKKRASRINGVNRNMYAMDDLAKRFSGSLAAIISFNLLIYLLSGNGSYTATIQGYIIVGVGLLLHFLLGTVGGTVTLFTVGEKPEKIDREKGLFIYLIRNILQVVAVGVILYFFAPHSVFASKLEEFFKALVSGGSINYKEYLPAAVELLAWIFIFVVIKHATSDTEYNREGILGSGMRNFRIFSFFTFLAVGALIAFSYLGFYMQGGVNTAYIITAATLLVAFILDCIIQPRYKDDDSGIPEGYFSSEANWYNNTII